MATYDDFDGVFFSIQALRMYHKEILDDIEIIIIDNNPGGDHSNSIKNFINGIKDHISIQHILFEDQSGGPAAAKNQIFNNAKTPYVLCMDSHILFEHGSLEKLIQYYKEYPDTKNLLQGPLVYDDLKTISTHFDPVWRGHMYGIWATDERGTKPSAAPFEIPMQGMGAFTCRKDSWPGFNNKFKGFGGEEGYIHEKFRQAGNKTLCLPFLRWLHRFERPSGVKYNLDLTDRIWNYFIGFLENGQDCQSIIDHFSESLDVSVVEGIYKNVKHFIETGEDRTAKKTHTPSSNPEQITQSIEEIDKATGDTVRRTEGTLCFGEPVPGKRIGTVYINNDEYPVYGDGFQKDSIKVYPHDHISERIISSDAVL
jgi:hypothetical protein